MAVLVCAAMEIPLRGVREAWSEGDLDRAQSLLDRSVALAVRPAAQRQAMAAILFARGEDRRASQLLGRGPRFPIIAKEEVGDRLVALGRYAGFLRYDDASHERDSSSVLLYRAAALLGVGRVTEAGRAFAMVDQAEVDARDFRALRAALAERRKGHFALVRDKAGATLAVYSFATRDLVAVDDMTAALIDRSGGELTFESQLEALGTGTSIETTLDPAIQSAAASALAGTRGSLVAIDLESNSIVAVVNSIPEPPLRNLAFANTYEPGSIVKVLTLMNAIDRGLNVRGMFPMPCEGFIVLGGRLFFDWARHGLMQDVNEAMAVSCNVAFAHIGLGLGPDELRAWLGRAGFGSTAHIGGMKVPLGSNAGPLEDAHAVASAAVGLERETVSPLHVAMLAAAIANGGVMREPRLVARRLSILGEVAEIPPVAPPRRIASAEAARLATVAMMAVVSHERGTGRRAVVEGLPIAMKTGTAGHSAGGYDSVIMAFAPAGNPRIAIGMIAENAGPAEFAGARIARDFFEALRPRLGL